MEGLASPDLAAMFGTLKAARRADPYPDRAARVDRLRRIEAMTLDNRHRIAEAISADFSWRAPVETEMAEVLSVVASARHARRRLGRWMKPRRAATAPHFWPLRNRVWPQPLGVVGILSPWNYPWQLAIAPLVSVLAAGNRALLKPSEKTPATAALIAELIGRTFDPAEVAVVEGGAEVAGAVASLPLDHILFTGSARTGRRVAEAAARNLVPVTLELGGKSPVIVDDTADLDRAARSIAFGKWFNAGQTCIAPDYALVPPQLMDAFVGKLSMAVRAMWPDLGDDYTAMLDAEGHDRMIDLVEEAVAGGGRLIELFTAAEGRKIPPVIVIDPPPGCRLMAQEVFGPVLPVVACASTEAAIAHVDAGPRPLALYWFGQDRDREAEVLRRTWSGGMVVNDCLVQFAQEELPFGGVGASGQGAYHGRWGFDRFSHLKAVTRRGTGPDTARLMHPPYGSTARRVLAALRRWV